MEGNMSWWSSCGVRRGWLIQLWRRTFLANPAVKRDMPGISSCGGGHAQLFQLWKECAQPFKLWVRQGSSDSNCGVPMPNWSRCELDIPSWSSCVGVHDRLIQLWRTCPAVPWVVKWIGQWLFTCPCFTLVLPTERINLLWPSPSHKW